MKSRSLQPHILALWTLFTTLLDKLPRCDHPPRVFFKASGCNPSRKVLGIRLDKRVEQHPCTLDVADLRVGFEDNTVEGGEIPFGVNRGGGAVRREAAGGSRDLRNGRMGKERARRENTWSSLSERILSRAWLISTKLVRVPGVSNPPDCKFISSIPGGRSKAPTCCCIGSKAFSYSVLLRSPTRTLSGTT